MTFLILPVSDISQINTHSFGILCPVLLDIMEAARERSIQGSSILSPRAIFE
jgi:hypothetical protein